MNAGLVDWRAAAADAEVAALIRLAAQSCGATMAGFSRVDAVVEEVIAGIGGPWPVVPRSQALAGTVLDAGAVVLVSDPSLAEQPVRPPVAAACHYAGAPVTDADGALGVIWVAGANPLARETGETLPLLARTLARCLRELTATTVDGPASVLTLPVDTRRDLLLLAVGAGYWDWDLARGQVEISPRFAELLALPAQPSVSPAEMFAALDDPDLEVVHDALGRLFDRRDQRAHVEFEVRPPDRAPKWVRLRGHVVSWSPSGQPLRALGLAVDITDERRLDDERRAAQRLDAIGALTAGVAHEINTPLQVVSHNLDFLASHGAHEAAAGHIDDDATRRDVEAAIAESIDAVDRVSQVVRALKEFAHQGRGRHDQVEVQRLLEHAITLTRHEWRHVATIDRDLPPEPVMVPGAAYECGQIFVNLILNAAHAVAASGMPAAAGRINVSARSHDDMVDIRISDNGTGMSAGVQERVFQPLFTTKAPGQGSGLGLATSRAIVERYGGTISFESALGRGTTFLVRLPRIGQAFRAA